MSTIEIETLSVERNHNRPMSNNSWRLNLEVVVTATSPAEALDRVLQLLAKED